MQLAHVLGIRIGVHASWFVVLFVLVFVLSGSFSSALGGDDLAAYAIAALAALLLFASILLHELGHALAARREGIEVAGIDLFFFGGLMRMRGDTQSAGAEFRVAAAGPLVTVVLVLLGVGLGAAVSGSLDAFARTAALATAARASALELLVSFVVSMNVLVLVLNLVPAFPLDGGRIARAVVWQLTGDRLKATRLSARLGQGFGLLLIAIGALLALRGDLLNGVWTLVLGWILWTAARGAVAQTAFSEQLRAVSVRDVMQTDPVAIPADLPADRAWDEFFLRYQGHKWFPVVSAEGRPLGIAHRAAVESAAASAAPDESPRARELVAPGSGDATIGSDERLDTLLGADGLSRHGALLAVGRDRRLEGLVTSADVARAVQAAAKSA